VNTASTLDESAAAETATSSPDDTPSWKPLSADAYEQAAAQQVHFSCKTVNSNARGGGVRLTPDAALNLPYICARTHLATGQALATDYTVNSGSTATAVKQFRAVAKGDIAHAPQQEVTLIRDLLAQIAGSGLELALEPIDARLRQVLIPHPDAPHGYVSLTPITAGGVCEALLGREGLATRHNELASLKEPRAAADLIRIGRVQLGIGGANPQNVGALVRSMQRPLLAPAPTQQQGLRQALRVYHKGIELPDLRDFANELQALRAQHTQDEQIHSGIDYREQERALLQRLFNAVLAAGEEARSLLLAHAPQLPSAASEDGSASALISMQVASEVRGLILPELRSEDWPERIAARVLRALESAYSKQRGERVAIYVLDASARASTLRLLEDIAR